jgi:hypothetical protein
MESNSRTTTLPNPHTIGMLAETLGITYRKDRMHIARQYIIHYKHDHTHQLSRNVSD